MKSAEVKFNEAIEALRNAGKLELFNEKSTHLSGVEPKLHCAETILKASRYIRKHNGADDNGHGSAYVCEADPREKEVKSYVATGFSESQARKVLGLPAKTREQVSNLGLNDIEYRQYSTYVEAGFSEAQALIMASPIIERKMQVAIKKGATVPEFLESLR